MWSKYLRRPDVLEKISFAQFAKMYRSAKNQDKESEGLVDDDENLMEDIEFEDEEKESDEDKLQFIITLCFMS